MSGFDTEEIIVELFHSLLRRYQVSLEQSANNSDFLFDYVEGSFYKCHKISISYGEAYAGVHCRACSLRLSPNFRVRPVAEKNLYLRLAVQKIRAFAVFNKKCLRLHG